MFVFQRRNAGEPGDCCRKADSDAVPSVASSEGRKRGGEGEMNSIRLCIVVIIATLVVPGVSVANGPTYKFTLTADKDHAVCRHMRSVLNSKFRKMWDAPDPDEAPLRYGPSGDFSWSMEAGVPPLPEANIRFRYSKSPATPEFSAIPWTQARMKYQDSYEPETTTPRAREYLERIRLASGRLLIAHVDIDNDGLKDTLIKPVATFGYDFIASPNSPRDPEYIYAVRSREVTWKDYWSWDDFYSVVPRAEVAILEGALVRPFRYRDHSYFLRYQIQPSEAKGFPMKPHESLEILDAEILPRVSESGIREHMERVICMYAVKQLKP